MDSIRKHVLLPFPFPPVAWKADVMAGIPVAICGHMGTLRIKANAKIGGVDSLVTW